MAREIRFTVKPGALRDARTAHKLSQKDLANIVSEATNKRMPEPTYNKIEAGQLTVELGRAVVIARILNQDLNRLFTPETSEFSFASEL